MLGEDHSLLHDFPEHKEAIIQLANSDKNFAEKNQQYNDLDVKIRTLELNNSTIDDESMRQLKHQRRVLKDALYERLQLEKTNNSQ